MTILDYIFIVFLLLLCYGLIVYVLPWLKSSLDDNKLKALTEMTEWAVRAANQTFLKSETTSKRAAVSKIVIDKIGKLGLHLTEDEIDSLIEGMVNLVKSGGENK